MKVEFTSRDFRDFAQRYQETYGWLERDGKPSILVKLKSVREDKTIFIDKNSFEYAALSDRGNFFSFLPVSKGSYLYLNTIVVVQRIPARQWKRGICENNTSVRDLDGVYYDINFSLLETIFGNTENNTIKKFKETLVGDLVLFNHQFSIYKNGVYVYNLYIGEYFQGTIKLINEIFAQELTDIITKERLPISIV